MAKKPRPKTTLFILDTVDRVHTAEVSGLPKVGKIVKSILGIPFKILWYIMTFPIVLVRGEQQLPPEESSWNDGEGRR